MTAGRVIIGGTDCTELITDWAEKAQPLSLAQRDLLRGLLAVPAATVSKLRPRRRVETQRAA